MTALRVPRVLAALAALAAIAVTACRAADADAASPYGPCYRECVAGESPKTCHFKFVEEIYSTMIVSACGACGRPGGEADCSLPGCIAADGVERTVYSLNRMVPGPAIHVCQGDQVVVDFEMQVPGHADTLHWHGLYQRDTPHMDGVSMVTQCPVLAGTSFRYNFTADEPGTYFYHSHNGINKVNGVLGALVVRAPPPAAASAEPLFDEDLAEHTVVLMDWLHVDAEFVFPGRHNEPGVNQHPAGVLINGKGAHSASGNFTPVEEFRVRRGRRYRFRVINSGGLSCPIVLRVEGHRLRVIASDSHDVQPLDVDTLYTYSGERYDVVLSADSETGSSFCMFAYSGESCAGGAVQVAVLRYEDDQEEGLGAQARCLGVHVAAEEGTVLDSPHCVANSTANLCAADLRDASTIADHRLLAEAEPTDSIVLTADFHLYSGDELFRSGSNHHFITLNTSNMAAMLSNVSFMPPPSPLLTQPGAGVDCSRCDPSQGVCFCTHIIRVPLGAYFELAVVETSNGPTPSHPLHLHGCSFRVLAMGTLPASLDGEQRLQYVRKNRATLRRGGYNRNPAAKDTILLPKNGFVIVRFKADNPGVWFFHCHYQYHMAAGMEAVFQVGETTDFVPPPPDFPKCGNYLPA